MDSVKNHGEISDEVIDSDSLYEDEEGDYEEGGSEEAETVDEGNHSDDESDLREEFSPCHPIKSLPNDVRNRVMALQALQKQKNEIRENFLIEIFKLQKKYENELEPILAHQRGIIQGSSTNQHMGDENSIHGIPNFWLHAMRQNSFLRTRIYPRDEEALEYLIDISCKANEMNPLSGFTLYFEFQPNPFFEEKILTKEYIKKPCVSGAISEWYLAEIVGSPITWKSDNRNLTQEPTQKKQRSKKTQEIRYITVLEQCESFFTFFDAPKFPDDMKQLKGDQLGENTGSNESKSNQDQENLENELEDYIDEDYEIACIIKERIVPRALDYFIGDIESSNEGEEGIEELPEDDFSSDGVFGESQDEKDQSRKTNATDCRQQ